MSAAILSARGRPTPEPTGLTEEFWGAAARRELVRPLCADCGRSFFTPQACCTHCLSTDWSYARSSGRGAVYSSTLVHKPPFPEIEVPFHLAVVDLEEGWSMLANVRSESIEVIPIGTRVEVAWLELAEGRWTLPVFVPSATGGEGS